MALFVLLVIHSKSTFPVTVFPMLGDTVECFFCLLFSPFFTPDLLPALVTWVLLRLEHVPSLLFPLPVHASEPDVILQPPTYTEERETIAALLLAGVRCLVSFEL